MNKIISIKNKSNVSTLKNSYYITLENAEKRTHGRKGDRGEGWCGTIGWYENYHE